MAARRAFLAAVAAVAGSLGIAGCLGAGGGAETTERTAGGDGTMSVTFETAAFEDGGTVPEKYTCEGDDVSPPLSIGDVPDGAASLAVVVDDPDAPGGTFTHWVLWDVPPDTTEISEDVPRERTVGSLGGAKQGTNGFDAVGYRGPCPPTGDGAHRYRFRLFVLDESLDAEPGAGRKDVLAAAEDRRIAEGTFTGRFARS